MAKQVTLDSVTYDSRNDEFVIYLVEDGPWPDDEVEWELQFKRIQSRVYDAMDVAIDGFLAKRFPESDGKKIRLQVDSPSGCPKELAKLVKGLSEHIAADNDYGRAISASCHIATLRIVTGHMMGRFKAKQGKPKR